MTNFSSLVMPDSRADVAVMVAILDRSPFFHKDVCCVRSTLNYLGNSYMFAKLGPIVLSAGGGHLRPIRTWPCPCMTPPAQSRGSLFSGSGMALYSGPFSLFGPGLHLAGPASSKQRPDCPGEPGRLELKSNNRERKRDGPQHDGDNRGPAGEQQVGRA